MSKVKNWKAIYYMLEYVKPKNSWGVFYFQDFDKVFIS